LLAYTVVDRAVSTELVDTANRAAITIEVVTVIAAFTYIETVVAADLKFATIRGAAVATHKVTIVAGFACVLNCIATDLTLAAICGATIAADGVAVVASFVGINEAVPTLGGGAEGITAIVVEVVAIIAELGLFDEAISTNRRGFATCRDK
jgi:hypothetical protein